MKAIKNILKAVYILLSLVALLAWDGCRPLYWSIIAMYGLFGCIALYKLMKQIKNTDL